MEQDNIIPHLFRTEYSKIVAVLCSTFHLKHIAIAEDIASDTFLKASESWAAKGVPGNPAAWLYTVAKNKAKDYFKHASIFETKVKGALTPAETETEIQSRLDTVLKTIYLLFNEGYFSRTNNRFIRKELCSEAIRLALVLTADPLTNVPQVNALLALMCFQSARINARTNEKGEAILLEQQNSELWDPTLIEKGNRYLVTAFESKEVSKYHLEAAIAYWHTNPAAQDKWQHILQLYNHLITIEYSPVTALNRAFAFARVYGKEKAIPEAEKLALVNNNQYHSLLGYLYAASDVKKAIDHYRQAIRLTKSGVEKQHLAKELEKLEKGHAL